MTVTEWRDVEYVVDPLKDARVDAFLEAVRRSHVNGSVILRAFRPADSSQYQAAERSDLRGQEHWLRCFLEAPSVRASIPELSIPDRFNDLPSHTTYSIYEFEEAITNTLVYGGAYHERPEDDSMARKASRDFVDAICGTSRDGVVHRIDGAWTNWFLDVAWDQTFVVQRWAVPFVAVLCITDTD